jgi:hypothetical protein
MIAWRRWTDAGKLAQNYPHAVVASPGRMTIQQGTQFGPYKILELIGSGGMGDVYPNRSCNSKSSMWRRGLAQMLWTPD